MATQLPKGILKSDTLAPRWDAKHIATAFKFAGLDENPRYQHIKSSVEMARALRAEGYRGLVDDHGFIKAVK